MPKHDVFVSYNRQDALLAEEFAAALRNVPLSVFFDRAVGDAALLPGFRWQEALEQAINDSRAVAVLIGPSGIGPTQRDEEGLAMMRSRVTAVPLITFRVFLPGSARPEELGFAGLATDVDVRSGIDNRQELLRIKLAIAHITAKEEPPPPLPAPQDEDVDEEAGRLALDDAVEAIMRRLSASGLTFLLGSGVSISPSAHDMAVRISERLRERNRDPQLPEIPWLHVAGLYYAVACDDDLAVETEIQKLLQQPGVVPKESVHDELAQLIGLVQQRLDGAAVAKQSTMTPVGSEGD
jgi:hypothetical protein